MNTVLIITKKLMRIGISLYVGNVIGRDIGNKLDKAKVAMDKKIATRREGELIH